MSPSTRPWTGSYTDNITGSGSLTKTGGGTLTLLGDNGYTGGTTVSGGTLAGTTVSLDGDISVAAGAHVELDQSAPGTFVGEITGGGSLTKDGTGTVTLSGTNNYSGGTDGRRRDPAGDHEQPAGQHLRRRRDRRHLRPGRRRQLRRRSSPGSRQR